MAQEISDSIFRSMCKAKRRSNAAVFFATRRIKTAEQVIDENVKNAETLAIILV